MSLPLWSVTVMFGLERRAKAEPLAACGVRRRRTAAASLTCFHDLGLGAMACYEVVVLMLRIGEGKLVGMR